MALTNNTTIKPIGQDAIAKALEADPSKLESYWDQNPDALKSATQTNPDAFSLTSLKQSTQQTTNQPTQTQTANLSNIGAPATTSAQTSGAGSNFWQEMQDLSNAGGASYQPTQIQQQRINDLKSFYQKNTGGAPIESLGDRQLRLMAQRVWQATQPIPSRGDFTQEQLEMLGRSMGDANAYTTHPLAQRTWEETIVNHGLGHAGNQIIGWDMPDWGSMSREQLIQYNKDFHDGSGQFQNPTLSGPGDTSAPWLQPDSGYFTGGQSGGQSGAGGQPGQAVPGVPGYGTGDQQTGSYAPGQPQAGSGQSGPVSDGGYQQPYNTPQPYTTGNPNMDAMATELINNLNAGNVSFESLSENDKALVLQGLHQAVASNPQGWNNIQNEELRNAYISRWGDPQEGVVGAEQNTTTPWGNVQGQWNAEEGGTYQAAANEREVGDRELASWQLNDLLATGSPLMMLARQRAADQAERSGMRNSSLAAGAAQAAMADRMTPLAQQNAQTEAQAASQNQALEMERRLNNAAMGNDMMNADRQRDYGYNLQQLAGDQDFAKQNLAGQKAADLANIEGQYKMLISENDSAARIFQATYDSIAQIISNHELDATEAGEKADYLVGMMESMMESLLAFENFDLDGSGSTGGAQTTLPASVQEMIDGPFGTRFQIYE